MCVIQDYVNARVRFCAGWPPRQNQGLQAFVAAHLLHKRVLGIDTITAAAVCTGVSWRLAKAASVILQSENPDLVLDILVGRRTLLEAAKSVRNRAKLIKSFKAATPEDRIALGHVVGVSTIFDTTIVPAL